MRKIIKKLSRTQGWC